MSKTESPVATESFLAELAALLPPANFSREPDALAHYGRDWTRAYEPHAGLIVWPRSTSDVQAIVRLCNAHRIAIVPSGGRTGLAGGAVATNGELVLSLERMNQLGAIDTLGATVRVEAGAVTQAVHEHAAKVGLTWPVDFASKGSSTVGGNIATNAGGLNVIRYGHTRQWVLGLEVVLADGTLLTLGGALEKNNTGVDLRQLFIGSEGILGIVVAATLKLVKPAHDRQVILLATDSLSSVLGIFGAVRTLGVSSSLHAFEFFTDRCVARVERHRKVKPPFAALASHYVLIELDEVDDLDQLLAQLVETGLVTDGVAAKSPKEARDLWTLREGISESLSATGLPHKNDVALPLAALEAFCGELQTLFDERYPGWEICLFGHIGDGNLHINTMKPDALSRDEFYALTHAADEELFALVQKYAGSISAEHGVGLIKRDFLHFSRTPAELDLMKKLKAVLDPLTLLNPGKVL